MPSSGLVVSDWDRAIRASHVERTRIVLAVADGNGTAGAARLVGISRPTVIKWRDRFAVHGLAGLDDEPLPGRPKTVDDAAIIAATLEPPPEALTVTHWSSRLLGRHLGIGDATVARAWRKYHLQPWRQETFKFSTDPELEAKVRDLVGLYLNPPEKALVCAWTRSPRSRRSTAPRRCCHCVTISPRPERKGAQACSTAGHDDFSPGSMMLVTPTPDHPA